MWNRVRLVMLMALAVGAATGGAGNAAAQAAVVEGQVVERGTLEPVAGALVTLRGRTPVTTDSQGWFRFPSVAPGTHGLVVQAFGFATDERELRVAGDTLLLVELDAAPIPLPGVVALARQVSVSGVVREEATGLAAEGARVSTTGGHVSRTSRVGRFRIREVPADVPITVWVEHFGFLPAVIPLEPERDTTLQVMLRPDPVAEAMMVQQMARLDERTEGFRYEPLPLLDREALLEYRNWLLHEVIAYKLGDGMARRIGCIVVDEVAVEDRHVQAARFSMLRPAEVHRVEVTEYPGAGRALMLRIYTRAFVQRLVNEQAELVPRELAMRRWAGRCR